MFSNRRRYGRPDYELIKENEKVYAGVKKVFAKLRKENLICRMGYLCCMSCASSDLSQKVDEKEKAGAVYFHQQDKYGFQESGTLHIRYFTRTDSQDSRALGHKIVKALVAENVPVDWDFDPNRTITVGRNENDKK